MLVTFDLGAMTRVAFRLDSLHSVLSVADKNNRAIASLLNRCVIHKAVDLNYLFDNFVVVFLTMLTNAVIMAVAHHCDIESAILAILRVFTCLLGQRNLAWLDT